MSVTLEATVAAHVYRMIELHNQFTRGTAAEMNQLIADRFEGWLYRPADPAPQRLNAEQIREGNRQAAAYYEGRQIRFGLSGLTVVPQGPEQAAVSYQIDYREGANAVRALVLEVWQREADGEWRVIRWHEEKGAPNA